MNLVTRVAGALGFVRKEAIPRAFESLEGGWHNLFPHSPFDFDRDIQCSPDGVLKNWTVFSCMTLIASDCGKMRAKLMEQDDKGIWTEIQSPAFSPVLRKPNSYQTWQKFIESWQFSKHTRGNTYVLKERDNRGGANKGVVIAMHVLDPDRVTVHVAEESGDVYYRLGDDTLAGVENEIFVPASEIIHDRMWCLFHPLIGLSPLFACSLAATQGLRIQANSATFFANMSRPSGTLTTPEFLTEDKAEIYKKRWNENYGPGKQGQTAILGNGLKYEAMTQTAEDSQLVEQLKMSAEMICATFHVPGWKVGVGSRPAYQNANIEQQGYYNDCLQPLVEAIEALLDDGLGLTNQQGRTLGVELDIDALLRMDESTLTNVLKEQVGSGITKPNEARKRVNLGPVKGGDTVYLQQQNYSIAALDKRDTGADPFGTAKPLAPTMPAAPPAPAKEFEAIAERLDRLETKESPLLLEIKAALVAQADERKAEEAKRLAEIAEQKATEESFASFLGTFKAMCERV